MNIQIEWYDLSRLIKVFGYDDFDADLMADYIENCCPELDFTHYIWNIAPYFVECLEGGKQEALDYIEEYLDGNEQDCIIYECKNLGGVYLQWG